MVYSPAASLPETQWGFCALCFKAGNLVSIGSELYSWMQGFDPRGLHDRGNHPPPMYTKWLTMMFTYLIQSVATASCYWQLELWSWLKWQSPPAELILGASHGMQLRFGHPYRMEVHQNQICDRLSLGKIEWRLIHATLGEIGTQQDIHLIYSTSHVCVGKNPHVVSDEKLKFRYSARRFGSTTSRPIFRGKFCRMLISGCSMRRIAFLTQHPDIVWCHVGQKRAQ